jgi:hypothetical protein
MRLSIWPGFQTDHSFKEWLGFGKLDRIFKVDYCFQDWQKFPSLGNDIPGLPRLDQGFLRFVRASLIVQNLYIAKIMFRKLEKIFSERKPQSQFLHSYICERSVYLAVAK